MPAQSTPRLLHHLFHCIMLLVQSPLLPTSNLQTVPQWRFASLVSKPSLPFTFHSKHADFTISCMDLILFPPSGISSPHLPLKSHLLQNLAQSMPIFLRRLLWLSLDNSIHTSTRKLANDFLVGGFENYCSADFSAYAIIFCKFHEEKSHIFSSLWTSSLRWYVVLSIREKWIKCFDLLANERNADLDFSYKNILYIIQNLKRYMIVLIDDIKMCLHKACFLY